MAARRDFAFARPASRRHRHARRLRGDLPLERARNRSVDRPPRACDLGTRERGFARIAADYSPARGRRPLQRREFRDRERGTRLAEGALVLAIHRCFALALALAAVVGCGGSAFTSAPPDPGSDASDVDAEDADAPDVSLADEPRVSDARPDAVVPDACSPVTFFEDGDSDGYGGTTTVFACAAPSTSTWVTRGGDCDDSNAAVNPGQSAFFAVGYTPPGATRVSYDYDCDGQESESGNAPKASCGIVDLSCVGSGYLVATPMRSGSGVDSFCGSVGAATCALTDLVCQAGVPYSASPIACH
jgi:hypothetical protein